VGVLCGVLLKQIDPGFGAVQDPVTACFSLIDPKLFPPISPAAGDSSHDDSLVRAPDPIGDMSPQVV
jgi:hypothetical protein